MLYQGKARYPVQGVILHCAGVPTDWVKGRSPEQVRAVVDEWHRQRGWSGIGYHQVIMPDGRSIVGRPWAQIGAHCKEANRGTLGFLMVESRKITAITDAPDWFTDDQLDEVERLAKGVPGLQWVRGHNHYAAKLCPGFEVDCDLTKPGAWRDLRDQLGWAL